MKHFPYLSYEDKTEPGWPNSYSWHVGQQLHVGTMLCTSYTVCKCQVSLYLDSKPKSRDLHQNESSAVAVRRLSNATGLCVIKKRWGLDTLKAVSDLNTTSRSWEAFQELQGYWTSTLHLQVLGLNVTSAVLNSYLEVTHKVRCRLKTAYKYSGSGMIVWNCAWLPPNMKILL